MYRDQIDHTLEQLNQLEMDLEPSYSRYVSYYEQNITQYYKNLLYQGCAWANVATHSIEAVDWSRYHTNKYRSTTTMKTHTQMRNIHNTHYCEDVYWAPACILYSTQPLDCLALLEYMPEIELWFEQHHMSVSKPWKMATLAGCWIEQGLGNKDKFTELYHRFTGYDLKDVKF